jgi:hypothetical protein
MFARSTALNNEVDRLKQEGRCGGPRVPTTTAAGNNGRGDRTQKQCDSDQAALDQMQKVADSMDNMGDASSRGRSEQATNIDYTIQRKRLELAAQGCRKPGAPPPPPGACLRASLYWSQDNVPQDEIKRRLAAAGCH